MRKTARNLTLLMLVAACQDALAVRLDYALEFGFLHSDNIAFTADNQVSETVLIPHLNFSISESSSSVLAEVSGVLEYRNYREGSFGSEFRGNLNGLVNWTLLPERLNWFFNDNLGLYPVSLRDPDVPGNLQQTNVFSTGPTFRFRVTPTLRGQAEMRFSDSHAEENGAFDSRRYSAALRGLYDLSSTRNFGGNIEFQQVDFDDDLLARDYTDVSAFVSYTQALSQLDLNASLGYSHLDFDRGGNSSGPLARLGLDWRISANSTLGLAVADQYTDAATSISTGTADFDAGFGGVDIGGAAITPDVYRERRVSSTYQLQGARLNFAALLRYGTYRYEEAPAALANDRDELGAGLNLGYLLRPTLTLGANAEATRREFNESDLTDRNYRYGVYLTQRMTRHLSWRADIARNERHSSVDADSYDENSVYLRFTYTR